MSGELTPELVPATPIPSAAAQIDNADLYRRWERGNWVATGIDFERDQRDWHEGMDEGQRRAAVWLLSLFLHGEDSVANNLGPFVDACPRADQRHFLITQQVDEARHVVFFQRFLHEVAGQGDGTSEEGLRVTDPNLTWGHRGAFGRLDTMTRELREDATRLDAAIMLYHIIIEGGLAQPTQHVLGDSLTRLGVLPGFVAGMEQVSNDEQRHIAFGVKLLSELYAADPERVGDALIAILRETLPFISALARPPTWDNFTDPLGFSLEDLYEQSSRSLEARLRAIGLPLDEMPRFPLPPDLSSRERAERTIRLMKAGMIGDEPRVVNDPEALGLLFDLIRREANPANAAPGTVIQWDFTDADPWHIVIDRPLASAVHGRAGKADLTLRLGLQDFIDLISERVSPGQLLLKRRLRVRGKPWVMMRLEKIFA